jgi:molecular chaperone HscA
LHSVAVVDIGAGTSEVSIAALEDAAIRIIATAGDGFLGGHDLARRVAAGLDERLRPQSGRRLLEQAGSMVAALGLLHAAEQALETLALAPRATVALDHGAGFGRDLFTTLRREQAEQWLEPDLQRIGALCRRALEASRVQPEQVDAVLLVGGGSAMPGVRRAVAEAFGRYPGDLLAHEPLALAAYGAALAGGEAAGSLWDVTPYPLGINCYYKEEELFSPILPANTPIPTPGIGQPGAWSERYWTRYPDQTSVRLDILQYRGPKRPATSGPQKVYPHECELLGSWSFDGLRPPPGGHAPFSVTFSVDADGILQLLAEEQGTGHRLAAHVERGL